jgi:uncharacterized protein YecE (DUF72 family)
VERTPEEILARRLRRQERRAKQRAANVGRAAKMLEARVGVEPRFVEPYPGAIANRKHLYVGCSGWYYWHWKGCFYPPELPGGKWFDHYASNYRTVELNAPFYSWPTVANVNAWIRQAGRRRFVYTVKVNELITHTKRFARTKQHVEAFSLIADMLGSRFGCFLFQLPPSFHYTAARLKGICAQLDPRRRNVVEFRHRSWWNETVYRAFRDHNTTFCSCSGPRLPDELVQTTPDLYLRFHGTARWYRHDYTDDELSVWARRVHATDATRVWGYFNNDRDGHALRNAKSFLRLLKNLPPAAASESP